MKLYRWVLDKVLDRRENCNAEEEGSVGIDCDSPLTTWTLAPWYSDPAPPVYASALEFKIPAESMYASNGKSSLTDLKMGSVVLTEYGQTPTNTEGAVRSRGEGGVPEPLECALAGRLWCI